MAFLLTGHFCYAIIVTEINRFYWCTDSKRHCSVYLTVAMLKRTPIKLRLI